MKHSTLLFTHECFTGKYTTTKIYMKPHSGLESFVFRILTSEDFDDFTDIVMMLMSSDCKE